MLPAIEKRMDELAGQIEIWASKYVLARSFPAYNSRWYSEDFLNSCYCLGHDDPFPCPHCMDYNGLEKHLGHPALVAEYARHWRALLYSDAMLESGKLDLCAETQHIDMRLGSAYHLYAISHGHLTVTRVSGNEVLVQDKPGSREGRNALLAMRGVPPKTVPTTASIAYTVGRGPSVMVAGAGGGGGGGVAPQRGSGGNSGVYELYKHHLEQLLNLHTTGMNAEGDVMLVKGGLLDDVVKCPHDAGYVVHEQAVVIKIKARDLLKHKQRREEQERIATELMEEWARDAAPVNDWMAAIIDVPHMGHSMCHSLGYSQEPIKKSGKRR